MDEIHTYTTPLAHFLLCGITGWAIKSLTFAQYPFAFGIVVFVLLHGAFGIIRFTHPYVVSWREFRAVFEFSTLLAKSLPLPFVNAELLFEYEHCDQLAYLFLITSILPIIFHFLAHKHLHTILNVIVITNICSLLYIGIKTENYWATGLGALYTMNHFILDPISDRYNVPRVDIFTIGLLFSIIFTVNCLIAS